MRILANLTPAMLHTTDAFIDALKAMDIHTVQDLAMYLPRSHEDLSAMHTIATAPLGEKVTIAGVLGEIKMTRIRGGRVIVSAPFTDTQGDTLEATWFNQGHMKRMLQSNVDVVLTGKISERGLKLQMQSPQVEVTGKRSLVHSGRLVPIYPQHDVISTRWLREKMVFIKPAMDQIVETLDDDVVKEEHLMSRAEAIKALHFPETAEDVQRARDRFAFEEMYAVQHAALERKKAWQGVTQDRLKVLMDAELIRQFFASLKFTPTKSQKIAIYEILKDMEQGTAMSRLLEGDVGSGKTLVAVAVMATVVRHKGQVALMVPTEVLARQHAETVIRMLLNFHSYLQEQKIAMDWHLPRVAVLTGSVLQSDAVEIKDKLAGGVIDIVIGTHALIQDSVSFKDLKLAIIDEQHRFGVAQRQALQEKGNPHVLAMTATPIPRTLALTAYGDHDLSVLLEKPGNRQPIDTKVVSPTDRTTVERFIDLQIQEGRQVFVICPLIETSEAEEIKEVKSVMQEVERLKKGFPHRRISLLHGRMPPQEKDDIMRAFKARQSDMLVSTSVIEVGIDVPNATIIVLEGSERFGLAQLHQFRGRVGRGDHKSYCFLFTTTPEQARSARLKAMEQYDSGFQLAEIDLQLRGPGELYGLRQSGIPEISVGSLLQPELVVRARRAAERALGLKNSVA